jgi:hypothetical protein
MDTKAISSVFIGSSVLYGIITGYLAGPASPQQYYVTYHSYLVDKLLGMIGVSEFLPFLGPILSNNVSIWFVIFVLGSVFPLIIWDLIQHNFYAITRMSLYLGPESTMAVMMVHGFYEITAIMLCGFASFSLFISGIKSLVKKKPEDLSFETDVLWISLLTLAMAAFLEVYVYPVITKGEPAPISMDILSWFYWGGYFAVPLILVSTVSLSFWEFFFKEEAHFPFIIPKLDFFRLWIRNMKIGVVEDAVFRLPVWMASFVMPPLIPSLLSSLVFGIAHYTYGVAKIPSAFTSGLVLCALTVAYGLPAAMICHAFLDLFLALQYMFARSSLS